MASLTTEERLSRLEGVYEHLATKDDVATLRGELRAGMATVKGELTAEIRAEEVRLIKWMVGGMAVWAAVIIGGLRLLGG